MNFFRKVLRLSKFILPLPSSPPAQASNHTQTFPEGDQEQKEIAALEENEALLNSNSASSINSGSAASLFHMAGYADLEFGKTYAPIATYRKQVSWGEGGRRGGGKEEEEEEEEEQY